MATSYESAIHPYSPQRSAITDSVPFQSTAGESCARQNVGQGERKVSLAAGAILSVFGLARRDLPGLLMAAVGGGLVYRGATGHCHAYEAMGVDTNDGQSHALLGNGKPADEGVHVEETFLIDKPAEELYKFWRNLENLPAIMTHLESVKVLDERRSHWIATAPKIVGGSIEWDAQITEDMPNSRIAWQSDPDSELSNRGSVEFVKAPGDRGTIVRVEMEYRPPAGQLGALIAKLFGNDPQSLIREDVRNFKRIMEIGDVLTTDGQPRGACLGGIGRMMH